MALNGFESNGLVDPTKYMSAKKGPNEWNPERTFQQMHSSDESSFSEGVNDRMAISSTQHQSNSFQKRNCFRSEIEDDGYNFVLSNVSNAKRQALQSSLSSAPNIDCRRQRSTVELPKPITLGFKLENELGERDKLRGRSPRRRDQNNLPTNAETIAHAKGNGLTRAKLKSVPSSAIFAFSLEGKSGLIIDESINEKNRGTKLRKVLDNSFQHVKGCLLRLRNSRKVTGMLVIDPVDTFEMQQELSRFR